MEIAVGICAVPERSDLVADLAERVDADLVVWDVLHRGERWCHQEALRQLVATGADWLVLLEDDALPCENFVDKMRLALDQPWDGLVSFYFGTGSWAGVMPDTQTERWPRLIEQGEKTGWIEAREMWHAVGMALPMMYAPLIGWHLEQDTSPTDTAVSRWCWANRVKVRYTYPSLVDHADVPSIVDGGDLGLVRRAVSW